MKWETLYDCCVKMFWQGHSSNCFLPVAVLISLFTYSWRATDILVYETFISTKTYWDGDKLARAHRHTYTHTPVTLLVSTKGDDPRTSLSPRRCLVWQICLTLHFLHNSLYYGPKWPAWSPWISMSSVSGFVNWAWSDACRQLSHWNTLLGWRRKLGGGGHGGGGGG